MRRPDVDRVVELLVSGEGRQILGLDDARVVVDDVVLVIAVRREVQDLPERARRTASANHQVAVYPNPFRSVTTVEFTPRATLFRRNLS